MIAHHAKKTMIVALSGIALCLGVAVVASPRWVTHVGLDIWNLSAERQEMRDVDQERVGIDDLVRASQREREACGHIATRLVNNTLTLEQAVKELSPILANRVGFHAAWQHTFNVPTFNHGVARYAIIRAQGLLNRDPDRLAEVTERLEKQYAAIK